jgi:tetratricopeptide (TPR) repeat protein
LATLHRESPLATRPLIWKAELLRRQGGVQDAEAILRRAIALDPQDTQAWESSTRFQAWEILARIETAQGKTAEAHKHMLKFVSADESYSDNGADWYSRVLNGPEKRVRGLADNPDDFTLRYSVADDLAKAGKRDEAKIQILEACRQLTRGLGPASVLDCQDDDPEFARLCETQLNQEITSNPSRPAPLAVLANLYQITGRHKEAVETYLKVVSLDADYLVAWHGLRQLAVEVPMTQAARNRIFLNLARLDPLVQGWPESEVTNFAELWLTADAALGAGITPPQPIFELPAAKLAAGGVYDEVNLDWDRRRIRPRSAGMILAEDRTIGDFLRLIETLGKGAGEK